MLDHDANQVETVRAFGYKVYFGDACRVDLLQAAGAAEAKILIIAIDEPEKTIEIVEAAQKHFPQLKLIARAYDRVAAYRIASGAMSMWSSVRHSARRWRSASRR